MIEKQWVLFLTLILTLFMSMSTFAVGQPMDKAKQAMVSLTSDNGINFCGGFAIAPHTMVTAAHCILAAKGKTKIHFNGKYCPTDAVVYYDGHDHVIVTTCQTYKHWVRIASTPAVGEHVFVWGHPDGLPLMYREGLYAGPWAAEKEFLNIPMGTTLRLYDFSGYFGDSGSGIYNSRGQVVGMVNVARATEDGLFLLIGSYDFHFPKEILRKYYAE